jgi:polyisoprenoid-binding protein YceI
MTIVKERVVNFAIDAKASLFTVQAFAAGMVAVVAHSPKFAIREFAGQISFSPENPEKSLVNLAIHVGSLEIMDEVRASDRREIERIMFDEVLEKSRYPKIEYKSSHVSATKLTENVYRVTVSGDLMLHGAARGMRLDGQVVVGEESIRVQGAFSVLQSDYGLKIASIAGGTLTIRDELKCGYFIVGRRAD